MLEALDAVLGEGRHTILTYAVDPQAAIGPPRDLGGAGAIAPTAWRGVAFGGRSRSFDALALNAAVVSA